MDKEPKNEGNKEKDNLKSVSSPENKGSKDIDDTNKYLAMEQPGVSYTKDTNPVANSDKVNPYEFDTGGEWNEEGGNSEYSDAFNQDDDVLDDNLDLDEDQNQSISSDDEDFEETNERY